MVGGTRLMIPRPFKKIQKFDLIENDEVIHLFKVTHLDNSTGVYDNKGKLVMSSYIKPNNNKEVNNNENQS